MGRERDGKRERGWERKTMGRKERERVWGFFWIMFYNFLCAPDLKPDNS